jgi:hypothetical protein
MSTVQRSNEAAWRWKAEVAALKEELRPYESGETRLRESRDGETWVDTTESWIDRLRRTIDLYDRIIELTECDDDPESK